MKERHPFLISVPHGGTVVPDIVRPRLLLTEDDIRYYCDPLTRDLFAYQDRAAAYIDTPVSRMVVDLNRPPLPLPLKDPDGIIKTRTIDGRKVWRPGQVPEMPLIHALLVAHYFPYHQRIDELIDRSHIRIGFDCHSMLPNGSINQKDAGKNRPLICLGNNGDLRGRARKGSITTCSEKWIAGLASVFRNEFPGVEVAMNNPFSGGFITNAHFWRKGIPWIQIEINRVLYEPVRFPADQGPDAGENIAELREKIWRVLTLFWEQAGVP